MGAAAEAHVIAYVRPIDVELIRPLEIARIVVRARQANGDDASRRHVDARDLCTGLRKSVHHFHRAIVAQRLLKEICDALRFVPQTGLQVGMVTENTNGHTDQSGGRVLTGAEQEASKKRKRFERWR